jgi:hypothetical protein
VKEDIIMRHFKWVVPTAVLSLWIAPVSAQQYCRLGEEKWIQGCHASCKATWNGTTCPQTCTATAPHGYVILDHKSRTISSSRGGQSVSRIPAGKFDYKQRVTQAYTSALDAAGKYGNDSATAKIREDMHAAISEAEFFESSQQMVRLRVTASRGGKKYIDEKSGWSDVKVELLVKCIVPANLENQLFEKYALNR